MIYLTQLLYIRKGKEEVFQEFEDLAIPLMATYGGALLLRMRPTEDAMVGSQTFEKPYEVHLVSFPDEDAFQRFVEDKERERFLHLKEESVQKTVLLKGKLL